MTSNKSWEKDNRPCFNVALSRYYTELYVLGGVSPRPDAGLIHHGIPAHLFYRWVSQLTQQRIFFFSKPENWRLFRKSLRDADRERIGNCIWKKKQEQWRMKYFFIFTVIWCPKTLWKTDRLLREREGDVKLIYSWNKNSIRKLSNCVTSLCNLVIVVVNSRQTGHLTLTRTKQYVSP